ncbi:hypothetical protein [Mucilaginibacter celer]|uniref:Uncharacterized protein n=1 Tax=Mucilaginibacter celer TaxID=2305508 RepID=A0A494VR57_9SPHI|nr:hypothetical protein [Mucilaginibacter celer]AYL93835.1 hypothetical protein HYN43_000330 [Mucilaginibacter celer]
MSKYFVFLILFIFPLLGKGQTITAMSIDTATRDTALITSTEMVGDTLSLPAGISRQLYVNATRMSGNYELVFSLQTNVEEPFVINPGSKVTFLMADSSTVEITSNSLMPSQAGVINSGQSIKISYPLPADQFSKLANTGIASLSVAYDGGSFDFTPRASYTTTIQRICGLLK